MTPELHVVESCDIGNGTITFSDPFGSREGSPNGVRVLVTDHAHQIHDVELTTSGRRLKFGVHAEWMPLKSLAVEDARGETIFAAQNLFPATNEDFVTQFKSARDRSGDPRIDQFVAKQIFDHFTGEEGYRVSSAVVAAYKAIELLDRKLLSDAESMLESCLEILPKVKMLRSARNNREHLQISVLCTLYHVYLAQGRPLDFVRTLTYIKKLLNEKNFETYYTLAFNSSQSLLLFALLMKRAGLDEDARLAAQIAFDVFKLSVSDADTNMAHFKELGYAHARTYETMRVGRRMRSVSEGFTRKTLRACLRVSDQDHPQAFARLTRTFDDAVKSLSSH